MPKRQISRLTDIVSDDELSKFLKWFFEERPFYNVPRGGISFLEGVHGAVLYREGNKQVQMFILAPNTEIPPHKHPNVDSYEVALWGMEFSHSGEIVMPLAASRACAVGELQPGSGMCIRVRPGDVHAGRASSSGGAFLSVQHWQNGVLPSSVANDWDGEFMGEIHGGAVTSGPAAANIKDT